MRAIERARDREGFASSADAVIPLRAQHR